MTRNNSQVQPISGCTSRVKCQSRRSGMPKNKVKATLLSVTVMLPHNSARGKQENATITTTITWLYSPSWALASCAIRLHKSLSWAFPLHPSIPISGKSFWTSSSHLTFGLPLFLLVYIFSLNHPLGHLLFSILSTWPIQLILLAFTNLTISSLLNVIYFLVISWPPFHPLSHWAVNSSDNFLSNFHTIFPSSFFMVQTSQPNVTTRLISVL
jgi:hypothetical protein